jgi:chromosome partitioning protein
MSMTADATLLSPPPLSALRLIRAHATDLSGQLGAHRLATFPPTAAKSFRRLTPPEAMSLLGINESYLRQTALSLFGPADPAHPRRTYSLQDIAEIRAHIDARSKTPGKYLPIRRPGEHLQCIAVVNFKGGSAKTTTAANLTQYLALHGYRTLAIDADPQGSLTTFFGVGPESAAPSNSNLYAAIRYDSRRIPFQDVIRTTHIPGLDLITGTLELMEFETETPRAILTRPSSEKIDFFDRILHNLSTVDDRYDVVVIDCPPQLGYLTMSALVAATSLLITVHPQMLDVESMSAFLTMLADVMDVLASNTSAGDLDYNWIRYLLTRFEPSDGPQNQMAALLKSRFQDNVLLHPTLKSTAISDAGLTSQTIYEVDPKQFTRSTYGRAIDSVNAVNAEIESLIGASWGRI